MAVIRNNKKFFSNDRFGFNTWEPVLLERKNGFEVPLCCTANGFSAKKFCRYSAIASRLHCNGDAITP